MTAPSQLKETAAKRVLDILAGRLERGGISTSRPDWYFQTEAGDPQEFPGGWQVRVRTWRHWSDAAVHFDADTGEVLHWSVDRLSDPPTNAKLTQEEALRIAAGIIEIPLDAELHRFEHEEFAEGGRHVARIEWKRVHKGLRVDGDYLWVMIHPETHRLVAFGRKWRTMEK